RFRDDALRRRVDIPQHQISGRVQRASIPHELIRFVVLTTELARIDPEVRVEKVHRRNARLHVRRVSFGARGANCDVSRTAEQTRMTVKGAAHAFSCAHLTEQDLHDRAIGFHSRFALGADVTQAANIAVQLAQPDLECFVRHVREYDVRSFVVPFRGRCDVRPGMDPAAYAYYPSRAAHANSLYRDAAIGFAIGRWVNATTLVSQGCRPIVPT